MRSVSPRRKWLYTAKLGSEESTHTLVANAHFFFVQPVTITLPYGPYSSTFSHPARRTAPQWLCTVLPSCLSQCIEMDRVGGTVGRRLDVHIVREVVSVHHSILPPVRLVPALLKLEPPYRLSVVDKTLRPYKNKLASGVI